MMRRKIRMTGKADMGARRLKAGDEVSGYEHNLKPLVDCGVAEWADLPEEPKAKSGSKKAAAKKTEVKDGD